MSLCKRSAIAALCLGVVFLTAAAWLPFHGDADLCRRCVSAGIVCLVLALLSWWSPASLSDSASPILVRRYYREFFPPMLAYVLVMLGWRRFLGGVDSIWLRMAIALLPALLLVIRAVARFVRDFDEMQRRIELVSIAIAAGLLCGGYMTAGFLQAADMITLPASEVMLWVFPALCIAYGVIKIVNARRYQ